MALTTLIGLFAIGVSARIEPAKVTIETKVFIILESHLVLDGSTRIAIPASKQVDRVRAMMISQFDESALLKNKAIRLISSPTIRTLNEMRAEIKIESKAPEGALTWSTSYTPKVKDSNNLNLDVNLVTTRARNPSQDWNFSTVMSLKSGQSQLLMVVRGEEKRLYLIKAHIED